MSCCDCHALRQSDLSPSCVGDLVCTRRCLKHHSRVPHIFCPNSPKISVRRDHYTIRWWLLPGFLLLWPVSLGSNAFLRGCVRDDLQSSNRPYIGFYRKCRALPSFRKIIPFYVMTQKFVIINSENCVLLSLFPANVLLRTTVSMLHQAYRLLTKSSSL